MFYVYLVVLRGLTFGSVCAVRALIVEDSASIMRVHV